jgi:hypothetical protein
MSGSFIKYYPQNTSLNVNSEEATQGERDRDGEAEREERFFVHHNLFFLLASLRN